MDNPKKNITILVVDDEQGMRDLLSYELSNQGYSVKIATNGVEALDVINSHPVNLVVCDLKMPVMNGITFLENLKKIRPSLEVIMTTGHGTVENAVAAMKIGAYDFLLKPFAVDELIALIEKALEKSELKTLVALYETSKVIFSATKLEELLDTVLDIVQKNLMADECSLMLLSQDNKLRIAASRGIPPEIARTVEIGMGERVAGVAALKKENMLLNDAITNYPEFKALTSNPRIKSSIVCPLVQGNELIGVLTLNRRQEKPYFRTSELQCATIFASQVALAVQNTKLYSDLKKRLDELKEAYRVLEETQTQLLQSEKLASIGRLVAGVAHEINNPLTAVIGYTQLLMESGGEDLQKNLTTIYEQAQRCGKIVQNLLVFARNRKLQSRERIYPCKLIEEVLAGLGLEMQKKQIAVVQKFEAAEVTVQGDPHQLKQVFSNILVNAIHALDETTGAKKIEIAVTVKKEKLEIMIADNGPGVAAEHRNRIFDPFFTTKEVGKGTGLGLSLSYGIIQEHGGFILVGAKDNKEKGAVFTIHLPLNAESLHPVQETPTSQQPSLLPREKPGIGKTVLVVEDEDAIRSFMTKALTDKGFNVHHAEDGEAALNKIKNGKYDVVICDYRLPKVNGWDLYQKVHQMKSEMGRRFVFVSGSVTFNEKAEDVFKMNNMPYLAKPFTVDQIMKAMETILTGGKKESAKTPR